MMRKNFPLYRYYGIDQINDTDNFQVPAFEATDCTCLTESNAIAYYVGNNALRASESPVHSAQVIQWMQFADSDILPASCTWVFPTLGKNKIQ